jgi:hypothetical protein
MWTLAVEFSGDLDLTALATFVLALVTFVSILVGGFALHRTKAEVDLSRQEVEEAHRPVLVPAIDDTKEIGLPSLRGHMTRPSIVHSQLVVPIKNIGSGPAMGVDVEVTPRGSSGRRSSRGATIGGRAVCLAWVSRKSNSS